MNVHGYPIPALKHTTNDIRGAATETSESPVRPRFWLCVLICLIWVVATVWIMRGGFKHFEVDVYLPYLLSNSSTLSKIFDSHVLDADCYSARELSYFFNYIDSRIIDTCTKLGFPHFMSSTVLLFVVLMTLAVWRFCMCDLCVGLPTTCALTLLFLTTPFSMFSSGYFRTGKIGVALLTALTVITMFRFNQRASPQTKRHDTRTCLWLFVLANLAMLFDRQGVFLTVVAICVIVLLALRNSGGFRWVFPLVTLLLAILFNMFYYHIIVPRITWAFHGYCPNLDFQSIPLTNILGRPFLYLLAGGGITIETLSFSFGNLPYVYFIAGFFGVMWLIWYQCRQSPSSGSSIFDVMRQYSPLCLISGVVMSFTLLNILMVCRHTPLVWPDVRRVYYWLPAATLWFMLATILVQKFQRSVLVPRRVLTCVLFLLVAGNITALPNHRAIIRNGHLKKEIDLAPRLIAALKSPSSVEEPLAPDISNDVIYQLFKNGRNFFDQPAPPISTLESGGSRIEVFSLTTNRFQYAFVPTTEIPGDVRGNLIQACSSAAERSGLFGPMCLTTTNGQTFRFIPRPLAQSPYNRFFTRIRVVNHTASPISYRIGSFVLTSDNGNLRLEAVGEGKWLFALTNERDRQAVQRQTRTIPRGGVLEFCYVYACEANSPKVDMRFTP